MVVDPQAGSRGAEPPLGVALAENPLPPREPGRGDEGTHSASRNARGAHGIAGQALMDTLRASWHRLEVSNAQA